MGSDSRLGGKACCSGWCVLGAQVQPHSRLLSLCLRSQRLSLFLRKKEGERLEELEVPCGPTPGASRGSGAGGAWSKTGG